MKKFKILYIAAAALLFAAKKTVSATMVLLLLPYRRTLLKTPHAPPLTTHGLITMP